MFTYSVALFLLAGLAGGQALEAKTDGDRTYTLMAVDDWFARWGFTGITLSSVISSGLTVFLIITLYLVLARSQGTENLLQRSDYLAAQLSSRADQVLQFTDRQGELAGINQVARFVKTASEAYKGKYSNLLKRAFE